jgi:hypothetical protein
VKLVDTQVLGTCDRKVVGVRIPLPVPKLGHTYGMSFPLAPGMKGIVTLMLHQKKVA